MIKIIKLIFLAGILIGGIYALVNFVKPATDDIEPPVVTSETAKDWKQKIDELCKKGKWTAAGYNFIETGIHTDRVTSDGELISLDEEVALQKYLFSASCNYLYKMSDELFKQNDYPANLIKSSEETLAFLNTRLENFGSDSNLANASEMISEYHRILGLITFSGAASYSHPLRPFHAMSADAARSSISALKYYKTHFCNNPSIRNKVDNLSADRARAEADYYSNLERAIESHYRSSQDFVRLLDDQENFNEMARNHNGAISRLNSFVNNPNR